MEPPFLTHENVKRKQPEDHVLYQTLFFYKAMMCILSSCMAHNLYFDCSLYNSWILALEHLSLVCMMCHLHMMLLTTRLFFSVMYDNNTYVLNESFKLLRL